MALLTAVWSLVVVLLLILVHLLVQVELLTAELLLAVQELLMAVWFRLAADAAVNQFATKHVRFTNRKCLHRCELLLVHVCEAKLAHATTL